MERPKRDQRVKIENTKGNKRNVDLVPRICIKRCRKLLGFHTSQKDCVVKKKNFPYI